MKHATSALLALAGVLVIASCSGGQNPAGPMVPDGASPANRAAAGALPAAAGSAHYRALCGPVGAGYARCFALIRTDVHYAQPPSYLAKRGIPQADLATAASNSYYGPLEPAQLQQAYNLPSTTGGSGQTVGIVDAYDNPTVESDLATYRAAFKLPACTTANGCFKKLNQAGQPSPLPSPNAGWAGEIALDVTMVSAICPNCHIVLVEATTNSNKNLGKAVAAAHTAGAEQISNSYGGPECIVNKKGKIKCYSPLGDAKYYDIPNTIITASSGDSGWFAGPQSPADFGTVVAVGGTSIYPYNNKRGWFETAWTDGGSSCSLYVKKPSWIKSTVKCPKGMRAIADVSAVADPNTGVLVYQTYPATKGGYYVYGGTSVASPIMASVYALAGNAATQNYGATLYNAPKKSLTDIVIGKNGVPGLENDAGQVCGYYKTPAAICAAMPGYDGPTGNGTPWGVGAF